jgi:two-component system response regulator AtoC
MTPSTFDEPESTTVEHHRDLDFGRLSLVVVADGQAIAHDLPSRGEVTIGRGERCDVCVDHPSVSRLHVRLQLGAEVIVVDAGSRNGTRVGGRPLGESAQMVLQPGEALTIGDVSLLLQERAANGRRRRVWDHPYFENRTEEECQRGEAAGQAFALVHLHLSPALGDDDAITRLGPALRATDVLASYGPGELELLAPGADRAEAEQRAARMVNELGRAGVLARTGVAAFPVDGASHHALASRALARLRGLDTHTGEVRVVVASPRMRELHGLLERVAGADISVLLLGETGVGKEVIAETLQRRSRRKDGPFVRLNCAALTESLLESELFGHERGAFTGATATKPGLLESAAGGTVLLDEVGELPMTVQVKLLRVLEERTVMRVGGLTPIAIDLRLIAATNRDLTAEIARGRFREDLFYRLAGVTITVPPLRDRLEELEPLAQMFIASFCQRNQLAGQPHLSARAVEALRQHRWPGNLRELRNLVERAVLLAQGPLILPEHLPLPLGEGRPTEGRALELRPAEARLGSEGRASEPRPGEGRPSVTAPPGVPLPRAADLDAERERIVAALEACAGNQTRAAQALGISRRTLVYRLDLFGLARPRKPR